MSITTERPGALTSLAAVGRSADGRDTLDRTTRSGSSVRTSRPRTSCASLERRRYLHTAATQGGSSRFIDHSSADRSSADRSFDDEAPRQTISWTATFAGVLITAIVLLGLVGLANLRAGYLDGGSAGAVTVVEQGGFAGQDLITATDPGQ